jgi:hypothetical protein
MGKTLVAVPSEFHEGTVWKGNPLNER